MQWIVVVMYVGYV